MAASTTTAEEEALLAEIARLSGQIDQAKSRPVPPYHHHHQQQQQQQRLPYYGRRASGYEGYDHSTDGIGGSRGVGSAYVRGRGTIATSTSRHRTLVLNNGRNGTDTTAAMTSALPSSSSATAPTTSVAQTSSSSSISDGLVDSTIARDGEISSTRNQAGPSAGWVKRKTTHNMSLVSADTFEKTEPARLAALQASQKAKIAARASERISAALSSSKIPPSAPMSRGKVKGGGSSAAVRRGDNMGEVIIDGVVFVFDESGTKLVKKTSRPLEQEQGAETGESASKGTGSASSATGQARDGTGNSPTSSPSKAPLRTSVNGQAFVRTKRGNLISAELLEKRKAQKESSARLKRMAALGRQIGQHERVRLSGRKARNKTLSQADQAPKGLCSFFTKTGQCKRGLSCPFRHDASRLAICPGSLRPSGCTQPAGVCPLSHNLSSPQRIPHCLHYLRSAGRDCRNGEECRYLHPPLALTAEVLSKEECGVCMDFARSGWCDRGESCQKRHTFDCADFLEKGSCERKGCRALHNVLARERMVIDSHSSAATLAAVGSTAGDEDAKEEGLGESGEQQRMDRSIQGKEKLRSISANANAKGAKRKRRRGLSDASEQSRGVDDEEGFSFVGPSVVGGAKTKMGSGRGLERKRKKGFTEQKDYIGFDDDDDDDDDDDEAEEDGQYSNPPTEGIVQRADDEEDQQEEEEATTTTTSQVGSVSSDTDTDGESEEEDDDEDEDHDDDEERGEKGEKEEESDSDSDNTSGSGSGGEGVDDESTSDDDDDDGRRGRRSD